MRTLLLYRKSMKSTGTLRIFLGRFICLVEGDTTCKSMIRPLALAKSDENKGHKGHNGPSICIYSLFHCPLESLLGRWVLCANSCTFLYFADKQHMSCSKNFLKEPMGLKNSVTKALKKSFFLSHFLSEKQQNNKLNRNWQKWFFFL